MAQVNQLRSPTSSVSSSYLTAVSTPFNSVTISEEVQKRQSEYGVKLSEITNGQFISLTCLKSFAEECLLSAKTDSGKSKEDVQLNIYAIIESVVMKNKYREVYISDPTFQNFCITVPGFGPLLSVKNIICVRGLTIKLKPDKDLYYIGTPGTNIVQIRTFIYDYLNHDNDTFSRAFYQSKAENCSEDIDVCQLLEEWFAVDFLSRFGLDKISSVKSDGERQFVNFACLVLGMRRMQQSVALTLYDGHLPRIPLQDTFDPVYASDSTITNSYFRFNMAEVHGIKKKNWSTVTVWSNDSIHKNDHYDVSISLKLLKGDDLLIFFNVEVIPDPNSPGVAYLVMRSGRQHGKGIRKVSRGSPMGKHLMSIINSSRLLKTN